MPKFSAHSDRFGVQDDLPGQRRRHCHLDDLHPATEAHRAFTDLVRRAQAQGELRADFVVDDLILVLAANRGVTSTGTSDRVSAARRFAALMIDGFRSSPTNHRLPSSPVSQTVGFQLTPSH